MVENKKTSMFKDDLKGEKIVGEFLDMTFYKNAFEHFRRTDNPREQFAGVDVVVQAKNGKFCKIDEKAQLSMLGNPTPTFAFEVAYLNKDEELKEGWLFHHNDTEVYLLGYFNKMNGNPKKLTRKEEIKEFEFVIIAKKTLINFLNSKGYTEQFLKDETMKLKNLIDNNIALPEGYSKGKTGYRKILEKGISVFYTDCLAEKPLNVVVNRRFLDELAMNVVRITTGNGGKVEIIK